MNERELKIGQNEALYRAVNERIEDLNEAFGTLTDTMTLVCECGDASCVERISLTRDEYEQLRGDPHLFAVAPGHVEPDVEEVAANRSGYDVVRKYKGAPRKIAEKTDPRSGS